MRRWWAAFAFLLVAAIVFYFHQHLTIQPAHIALPADGAQHEALRIRLPFVNFNRVTSSQATLLDGKDGSVIALLLAPVNPGQTHVLLHWRGRTETIPVTWVFDPTDSYGDGTPDFLRLHTGQDRAAFLAWFVLIAQAQLHQPAAEINDCAALLRFAYRESLHAHDEPWLLSHRLESTALSVRQYTYPQTPLGANLFRVTPGPFVPADLHNGAFAQFADAQTLMLHNAHLIGRDFRLARPGDLIFYRQLDQHSPYDGSDYHSPFHSMIVTGDAVVYHTGPINHGKGEMRRLLISDLLHHPDPRWRPLKENENFLGVYRWNIVREGD
jgi:uncharacterized protein YfaT (DUF1175 family)